MRTIALITGILMILLACSKPDDKSIDCQTELGFVEISYAADTIHPRFVSLALNYTGSYTVSVVWRFGDGTPDTVAGITMTHTYATAGSFKVESDITLSSPGMSPCSGGKSKTIHVL